MCAFVYVFVFINIYVCVCLLTANALPACTFAIHHHHHEYNNQRVSFIQQKKMPSKRIQGPKIHEFQSKSSMVSMNFHMWRVKQSEFTKFDRPPVCLHIIYIYNVPCVCHFSFSHTLCLSF